MSECVVRMEMPESCPCDLVGYGYSMCCSAVSGVPKRVAEYDECVKNGTKPDWCPIICSLPEGHGRLVDAEILRAKLIEHIAETNGFGKAFNETPTIVPAERSEI